MDQETINDIEYILETVTDACYCDELSLLRISLRKYLQGGTAADAVAWASEKLSDTITFYDPNSGLNKERKTG